MNPVRSGLAKEMCNAAHLVAAQPIIESSDTTSLGEAIAL
jgi:hypothetical protein